MDLNELFSKLPQEEVFKIMSSPLEWAETVLLIPKNGKPFEASYMQQKILGSTKRFNVVRVHRRAGKSYALSILALYYALTRKGIEVLVICPDGAKVANIFDTIRAFVNANEWMIPLKTTDHKNLPQRITFENGSIIQGFTTGASSKQEAKILRGQGADLVLIDEGAYLQEEDWSAIDPILTGDMYRAKKTRVFVASTPAYTRGKYYELCTNPRLKDVWNEVFVPIDKNPSVSKEFIEECSATCTNDMDWRKEYLAQFPELGEGVFPKSLVDKAKRNYVYQDIYNSAAIASARGDKPPTRTIGVDWDKYNKDGHGSTIAVLETISPNRYRLIYKEEIDQSKFTLTNAVRRVIELNDIFEPEWIFIDRGYGDMQLEELQKYGKAFPKTNLAKKVQGIQFAENVDCPMPGGGMEKKRFKQAMVSLLRTWFEKEQLELPRDDNNLFKNLIEYHVVSQSESSIKYSDENDHDIAAIGLAAMAMHHKVKNPYAPEIAHRSYVVAVPDPVPSSMLRKYYGREERRNPLMGHKDMGPENTFSRRSLGNSAPGSRSTF